MQNSLDASIIHILGFMDPRDEQPTNTSEIAAFYVYPTSQTVELRFVDSL